ncbi:hypothetical protein AAEX28_05350 [Lentisphaerota bacterium WC36G]|nr:hypothetical protein LJT99_08205 [Lentisphaerae bacterium WC36]
MKSLLHCLWTGPAFPYHLRCFIKNWVGHFRKSNSEFQLVVWLTSDSYDAATKYLQSGAGIGNSSDQAGWERCMPGVKVLFNKAKLNLNSFYIALVEPEFANYPETLQAMFKVFQSGKRYTTIGNIGRLMALNACGGIYTDVDYLNPNPEVPFPRTIDDIMQCFNESSNIDFYLSGANLDGRYLIENQAIVLHPRRIGVLTPLLREMSQKLAQNFEEVYLETQNNAEFLQDVRSKRMAKTMFTEGDHKDLMEAYKAKDFEKFNNVNAKIFQGTVHGHVMNSAGLLESHSPALDKHGTRHRGYRMTGKLTYSLVGFFFSRHLQSIGKRDYINRHWTSFERYFDSKDIANQFQFLDRRGHRQPMYSWANPGFSRLNKFEAVANKVQERYIASRNMLSKQLLINMLNAAATVKFGRLESRQSKQHRMLSLRNLTDMVQGITRNYFPPAQATELLKQFLVIAFIRIGKGSTTNMGKFAVDTLNTSKYEGYRHLIDPEKKQLSYGDVEAFARMQ